MQNIESIVMHRNIKKLEVITNRRDSFEVGVHNVISITIDVIGNVIEIKYDKDSDWKYNLIPFNNIRRINFNIEN